MSDYPYRGQEPDVRDRERYVAPHRGSTVLTLGILGLVLCFICGIIAWTMANNDLRSMHDGRMDRSGEGLTSAGRTCGIVSVVLGIVGVLLALAVATSRGG